MAHRQIFREECDSVDDVQKLFQEVFDDMELMNAKLCQVDEKVEKPKGKPKGTPKPKTSKKKKGMATVKNLIVMVTVLLAVTLISICYSTVDLTEVNFENVTAGNFDQILRGWFATVNDDVANASAPFNMGTGQKFFVDSGAGSDTYGGRSVEWAKATLDAAVGLCESNRGDIIYLAQGHQEVLAAAGDIFDIDVAGITVIGLSNGGASGPVAAGAATLNLMPVFILDHADATATMSAPNCRISGIKFESDVADNAIGLTISAAADGYVVDSCIFRDGAAAEELVIGINVAANADDGKILNNQFSTVAAGGCANAVVLAGGSDNTVISGNTAYGTYSAGALLASAALSVNLTVTDNVFVTTAAVAAVTLKADTTGIYAGNYAGSTTTILLTVINDDAMYCWENYDTGAPGASGVINPAIDAD